MRLPFGVFLAAGGVAAFFFCATRFSRGTAPSGP
jgi:hypothetical protein